MQTETINTGYEMFLMLAAVSLSYNAFTFNLDNALIQSDLHTFLSISMQQLGGAGPMQPGQVAPNQNFLNRPPGPIPVSHGNVQQQVNERILCWHVCPGFALVFFSRCLLLKPLLPRCPLISACLTGNPFLYCPPFLFTLPPPLPPL